MQIKGMIRIHFLLHVFPDVRTSPFYDIPARIFRKDFTGEKRMSFGCHQGCDAV